MSTKWSDFCISKVRYNSEHTHIVKVKVHADNGDSIGSENEKLRSEVADAIESRKSFVTIYKNSDGKWTKGEDVRVVLVSGTKYIRTDANSKASDNLGNLPEF
jgi:hypothetical protein